MITTSQLRQTMPGCEDPVGWAPHLNKMFALYKFTDHEIARILAQIAVESSQLNFLEERLRYSAQRIVDVWPKRFPAGIKDAQTCAWNPTRLANRVYAKRLGNGPEECGDGYRFRGRGLIQITGRDNYKEIGKMLGLDLVQFPDALLERRHAAMAVGAYWTSRVTKPTQPPSIEADTKAVTGGDIALEERRKFYVKALKVMSLVSNSDSEVGSNDQARAHGAASRQEVATTSQAWFE